MKGVSYVLRGTTLERVTIPGSQFYNTTAASLNYRVYMGSNEAAQFDVEALYATIM